MPQPGDEPLPTMKDAALSILLWNDAGNADWRETASRWESWLNEIKRVFEIIVVSGPESSRSSESEEPSLPAGVQLIIDAKVADVGEAFRRGLKAAKHPVLIHAPASTEYQPRQLSPLLEGINDLDLVAGFRAGRPMPTALGCLGFAYRWAIWALMGLESEPLPGWPGWQSWRRQCMMRWLYGLRILDVDTTFMAVRRKILKPLALQSSGPFVLAEVMAKAKFVGCLVDETPIEVPALEDNDSSRKWRQEFWQVFRQPEFGKP